MHKPLIIGHRGAPNTAPENTFESFDNAFALGADGIELDVRFGDGGSLVIKHDPPLPGEELPDFLSFLKKYSDKLLNIEIKADDDDAQAVGYAVAEALAAFEGCNFIISSFSKTALIAFREKSKFPIGLLCRAGTINAVEQAVSMSADYIHPHFSLINRKFVKAARAADLPINTYTVNSLFTMRRLARMKINAIITNDIPKAKKI